jgi:hypothetical protein
MNAHNTSTGCTSDCEAESESDDSDDELVTKFSFVDQTHDPRTCNPEFGLRFSIGIAYIIYQLNHQFTDGVVDRDMYTVTTPMKK